MMHFLNPNEVELYELGYAAFVKAMTTKHIKIDIILPGKIHQIEIKGTINLDDEPT